MAATIEAMGADLTFRQSDRLHQGFQRIKFQGAETETFGNDADHFLVFRRVCLRILL